MNKPMIPRERCAFSAIVDRPALKLPGETRLVFWSIVNLEVWDIARAMARQVLPTPTGVSLLADVPNWSWHEYGMRVGVWRFFELFAKRGIRPSLALNARVCQDCARVAEEARNLGWEFMGHGYEQMPIHQEAHLAEAARSIPSSVLPQSGRSAGWVPGSRRPCKPRNCSPPPG